MIASLGKSFADVFVKIMPNAYVFALLLTLITGILAFFFTDASFLEILEGWYNGFWSLLAFGMQIVLIVITAYSIAQSASVTKAIDWIATFIKTPRQVYFVVLFLGTLLSLISFGMIVVVAILARALALRIKGIHYPFLVACVYFSMNGWVAGFSSSIALLLNTEHNFLIEAGILTNVIPSAYTLGSTLNLVMIGLFLLIGPLLFLILIPKDSKNKEFSELQTGKQEQNEVAVKTEANSYKLPFPALSDFLNNSALLQLSISLMGFVYIAYHFKTNGFDLNFNIMIFIFLMMGLLLHKTPMRYSISMKRASKNVSGILFQYPFYSGIMGIMLATGLGALLGDTLASVATLDSYPLFAYLAGGSVNFAIPSAGGEFAVIGPSIISVVQELGTGMPEPEVTKMIARAAMSVAYGESLSNLLQPFYLLIVFPVMGSGVKLQARDIIGFLVLPFLVFFMLQVALVLWMPL